MQKWNFRFCALLSMQTERQKQGRPGNEATLCWMNAYPIYGYKLQTACIPGL